MATPVIMPRQGQSVETCIITQWLKKKGDLIKKGDILFSYETDKAAFEEEAQADGILLEVFFNDGDEVPVLTSVAVIGEEGESTAEFRPSGEDQPVKEEPEGQT
jgi:pyruvate dehydrogenase E2 component (dihydrolipoamide acetyltransferase)